VPCSTTLHSTQEKEGAKGGRGRGRNGNDSKEAIRENAWKRKGRKCNCVKWEGKGRKREQGSRENKREYAY